MEEQEEQDVAGGAAASTTIATSTTRANIARARRARARRARAAAAAAGSSSSTIAGLPPDAVLDAVEPAVTKHRAARIPPWGKGETLASLECDTTKGTAAE